MPKVRADLTRQQGVNLAFIWQYIADAELGVGQVAKGLDAIAKAQGIVAELGDRVYGPQIMESNAALYAEAGRPELAVPLLAKSLGMPGIGYNYSPVLLWLDPAWAPIRHDKQFEALLAEYGKSRPSAAPTVATTLPR